MMPCAKLGATQSGNWEPNVRTTLAALAFLASFILGSRVHAQVVADTVTFDSGSTRRDTDRTRRSRAIRCRNFASQRTSSGGSQCRSDSYYHQPVSQIT